MAKSKAQPAAPSATTRVGIHIGISDADRSAISEGLARLLADTYTLYLTTHNFHWNVTGPMFTSLHAMFMGCPSRPPGCCVRCSNSRCQRPGCWQVAYGSAGHGQDDGGLRPGGSLVWLLPQAESSCDWFRPSAADKSTPSSRVRNRWACAMRAPPNLALARLVRARSAPVKLAPVNVAPSRVAR